MAVRRLGAGFTSRMSRLTASQVQLFSEEGLAAGTHADYAQLEQAGAEERNADYGTLLINEVEVADQRYFQGILPLQGESGPVGAVAALYSKAHAQQNTWETIRLLTLVSLVCVLLVVPVTLVFSNSITRPLQRIIQGLEDAAGGVASATSEVASSGQELAESSSQQAASKPPRRWRR
jgi:methyl-accepting chemotaxis protein